jgi:hypothetical protein
MAKGQGSRKDAHLADESDSAKAIVDNFAGDGGPPPDIALALGISPTSSVYGLPRKASG